MIQRFIELGEGYSDLYELLELGRASKDRVRFLLSLKCEKKGKKATSLAIVMNAAAEGNFQPIYICREGLPDPVETPNKRYQLFEQLAADLNKEIITLDVKPSTLFAEKELYFQYLIGILRMNRYLPPLS
ncbi:DUF7147 family protein [Bacillus testis]|uniref:DUF7147 family protein n=1 Tax=Bacillus testis TaxID=1622072 RepID=UPI00067F0734|nr:hypothetical protein [Bacillus testis]